MPPDHTSAPMRPLLGIAVTAGSALAMSLNSMAVIQVYAHGGNAQTVVLLRYAFFIAAFLAVSLLMWRSPLLNGRHTLHALGSGAIAGLGSMGLLGSYSFIPISLTIVLVYTYPIVTALMLSLLQWRWPGILQLACFAVALMGAVMIVGLDQVVLDWRGIALAVLASLCFAGAIAWNAVALTEADATNTSFIMSLSGIAVVALAVFASGTCQPPSGAIGWLAMLGASVGFSLAFFGMYWGVQLIGGTPAAMVLNLEPVFTVILAAALLGQTLTPKHLIGGALVIGAVVLSQALDLWQARGRAEAASPA